MSARAAEARAAGSGTDPEKASELPRAVPPPRAGGGRSARKVRPKWIGQSLKLIRRVHLYLGLVLLPFLLIFGVSGVLFNHGGIGTDRTERDADAGRAASAGLEAWDGEAMAREIVSRLNADGGSWTLDPAEPGRFFGPSLFVGQQQDGGRVMVSLRLDEGSAVIMEMPPETKAATPPFAGEAVQLEGRMREELQPRVAALLAAEGIEAKIRPHPRPPPQLRFRVADEQGQRWNVTWDSATGQLAGRDADASVGSLGETMKRLHKLHNYPTHPSVMWLWIFFADLTGIAMVLWAVTGLVMWWQLKPTRVIGVVATAAALGIGLYVYLATAAEAGFVC